MIVATGSVSVDVLLALFIMSLAPLPVDCWKAPVTSLRYISLAYSLGQSMGLDTAAQINIASPWLVHESWADSLSELLLVSTAISLLDSLLVSGKPFGTATQCRSNTKDHV